MTALQTTNIKIDIEVHRAIENQRTTFGQSPNDILREVFKLPEPEVAAKTLGPIMTAPTSRRRTGTYVFVVSEKRVENDSLKAAYVNCLRTMAKHVPQFLERLSKEKTRARRIIAQKPEDLYLRSPELAEQHALPLENGWWVDTNLSQSQVEQRLKTACGVAGLQFGSDLELDFPK